MYDVTHYPKSLKQCPCWFSNNCEDYMNSELCHNACPYYYQFFHLVNLANIPTPLQYPENLVMTPGKDENEHRYLKGIQSNIVEWVQGGNNLYLYSKNPGNGKTTWSIKLMLSYFSQIMDNNGTKCRGLFLNVDKYFFDKKNSLSRPDERFNEMEKLITEVDLVIWDDFGNKALTDYEFNLLYSLIDTRISNFKSNIYTSNVIDNLLYNNVGTRISDRVLGTTDFVEFINLSQRKPIGERGRK